MADAGTRIYLVCHGAVDNPQAVIYGRLPGFPLNETGREQVLNLAEILKSKRIRIDAIYTSPLKRAVQTAKILENEFAINVLDVREELTDTSGEYLEGKPMDVLREVGFDSYREEFLAQGVETPQAIITRTNKVLMEVKQNHHGENVALVFHGDPLRFLLWSLQHPDGSMPDTSKLRDKDYVGPAEAVLLRFDGDKFLGYEHIRRIQRGSPETDQGSSSKEAI